MHLAMAASHLELQVQRTSQGTVFSEENLYNTTAWEKNHNSGMLLQEEIRKEALDNKTNKANCSCPSIQ